MNIELGTIIFIYKDDIVENRSEAGVQKELTDAKSMHTNNR